MLNKNKLSKSNYQKERARKKSKAALQELALVKRCKKGDDAAFAELVKQYQTRVYAVALGMVKNPEDAMDISQDAFLKIYRYMGNFQGASSFYTWMYRIVVNLSIDHLRRKKKYYSKDYNDNFNYTDDTAEPSMAVGQPVFENPQKNLSRKELAFKIKDAIEELPDYHKAVIIMREIEGMSYNEMAKIIKVSKGTIMSRLHHARKKLKVHLAEYVVGNSKVAMEDCDE